METLNSICPGISTAPTANTIQSWVLRLGLHALTCPKEQADDWVLLVDHTIQLGNQKCLIIAGIRLAHWTALERPIQLSDLSVISIEVVDVSNSSVVRDQLNNACKLVGDACAIVSDQGSDLIGGINLLEQSRLPHQPPLIGLTDMSHRAATALKHVLEKDSNWTAFIALCGKTQPKVKQTELGALLPPKLKVKARYMNLDPLIGWSQRMLTLLDTPPSERPEAERLGRLDEKFGWLLQFRESIQVWGQLTAMVQATLRHARQKGFAAGGAEELAASLAGDAQESRTKQFRDEVVEAMRENIAKLQPGQRIPASSEILESLIGKGKQLGRQHCREGFTRNVLAMAASVTDRNIDLIKTSFKAVKNKTLSTWVQDQLGTTLTTFRRRALPIPPRTKPA